MLGWPHPTASGSSALDIRGARGEGVARRRRALARASTEPCAATRSSVRRAVARRARRRRACLDAAGGIGDAGASGPGRARTDSVPASGYCPARLSAEWPEEQTARNMNVVDLAVSVLFELAPQSPASRYSTAAASWPTSLITRSKAGARTAGSSRRRSASAGPRSGTTVRRGWGTSRPLAGLRQSFKIVRKAIRECKPLG